MNRFNTATPYSAAYVILRRNGKIAFVLRSNTSWMNGYYGLPSGKIEKGESARAAAIREAKEEVGVEINPQDLKHVLTGDRHEETDWLDICFEAVTWQGEPSNVEPNIHSELAWLDPQNFPDNVIPSVHYYFQQIQAGNNYAEYGW